VDDIILFKIKFTLNALFKIGYFDDNDNYARPIVTNEWGFDYEIYKGK
jgi:hypothetical protein